MIYVQNGTLVTGSPIINFLESSKPLKVGMYVYGDGIAFGSKILTVDNTTQITVDKNALKSAVVSLEFTWESSGERVERLCAQKDVQDIANERGQRVIFDEKVEGEVVRDRYGSIMNRAEADSTPFSIWALPVEYRPTTRSLEQAGLREEAEVLVCTPKKSWDDLGVRFEDIDQTKTTARINDNTYEVREKVLDDHYGEDYLYINFGLFKR